MRLFSSRRVTLTLTLLIAVTANAAPLNVDGNDDLVAADGKIVKVAEAKAQDSIFDIVKVKAADLEKITDVKLPLKPVKLDGKAVELTSPTALIDSLMMAEFKIATVLKPLGKLKDEQIILETTSGATIVVSVNPAGEQKLKVTMKNGDEYERVADRDNPLLVKPSLEYAEARLHESVGARDTKPANIQGAAMKPKESKGEDAKPKDEVSEAGMFSGALLTSGSFTMMATTSF